MIKTTKFLNRTGAGFNLITCFYSIKQPLQKEKYLKIVHLIHNLKLSADYNWALKCNHLGYKFQFSETPIVNFEEGGFSDKNKILARIEEMYIQSKFSLMKSILESMTKFIL